ncbi:unnamed protein product [Cuscuta europaea]|uniref:Uncharacterized protein n=1 Tax=Cuscuta europaea TaxID=41803 RepID=A0A9P1E025_CUSEU|nr:unnamed protein product [Cuscuta europaea]
MSISRIETCLGFDEVEEGARGTVGLCDLPPDVNRQAFWESIMRGGTTYKPRESPSTYLYPQKYRVIHTLLNSTVTGKAKVGGKVSTTDLLCLYRMIHNRKPHMASIIAGLLHRQSTYNIKALYSDPYITSLLKEMGYGDQLRGMEGVSTYLPLMTLSPMHTGVGGRVQWEEAQRAGGGGQSVDHQTI